MRDGIIRSHLEVVGDVRWVYNVMYYTDIYTNDYLQEQLIHTVRMIAAEWRELED